MTILDQVFRDEWGRVLAGLIGTGRVCRRRRTLAA
jgi:hypothetical protein